MEIKDLLRGVIKEMVESRMRETDITDGSRVPFGSQDHVIDLEMRIADLERWRDRQRRGSEARANYARLISRLRAELRSASRIANPNAPPMPVNGLDESDDTPISTRMSESYPGANGDSWIVVHKYDGITIGFPMSDFAKAQAVADVRNDVAVNGAWGRNNPGLDPPYEVHALRAKPLSLDDLPFAEEQIKESVNMKDPEYASVEVFVQYLLDDERDTFTHEELTALNFRTRMSVNAIRKELEGYGITLVNRPNEKKVRGFSSNSNDRWFGPGSMATHGGAGIDPQTGRATSGRGDI